MRTLALAILLLAPALAGCMQDAPPQAPAPSDVASSAADAGESSGPAPSAPSKPYRVETTDAASGERQDAVAHPLRLRTTEAKEPVTLELEGEYAPHQCSAAGNLDPTTPWARQLDLSEALAVGDVFQYNLTLAFTNSDGSWADLHLAYALGATNAWHADPTADLRGEVVLSYEGQGHRVDADEPAWAQVVCYYGMITEPLAWKLTATFTFGQDAVPAETPVLVRVPENATRLFVRGVAVDPARPVTSHYRVFGPDDALLCECALSSNEAVDAFALDRPGDYVVLVDHTDNGFVSLALDAPPPGDLVPLESEWLTFPVYASDGETGTSATVEIDLPRVPLLVGAMAWAAPDPPASVGAGKKVQVTVANERGQVLHRSLGGYVTYALQPPTGGAWTTWMGAWPADWAYADDHHAYDLGPHVVTVTGEAFRGEVVVWVRQYAR